MQNPLNNMLIYFGSRVAAEGICRDASAAICNLTALTLAMGSQDSYTQGHARRVAVYAERMAQRLGLSAQEVETLRIGGLLHDIGKIAFSPKLLNNTRSRLSQAMRTEIRRHPEIGVSFLKAVRMGDPVIDCVRYHHERLNGSGYPCGLKADEIPLGAQIISVADCFDALTTDRPYQKGRDPAEAIRIMEELGGKHLSRDLVRVLTDDVQQNSMGSAKADLAGC
jgi:putative nucleotidyltransferase with HDIG domain